MSTTTNSLLNRFKVDKYNLISLPTIDLPAEEADRFLDCVYDQSVYKNFARFKKMSKPTQEIRHLGFGSGKFLHPAGSMDESKYKKQFKHNKLVLKAVKFRGCLTVFDDDLEEGLEGAAFKKHLMDIVAKKMANELAYAYYMGDTHGYNTWQDDDIEGEFDGWRYMINNSQAGQSYYNKVCGAANIMQACACGSGESGCEMDFEIAGKIAEMEESAPYRLFIKYGKMLKRMPAKYSKDFGKFRFINHTKVTQDYLMSLENKGTNLGDRAITEGDITRYHKVPIVDMPLMPNNLGSDGGSPDAYGKIGDGEFSDNLLTPKGNLIVGMQRSLKIESERKPSDEATNIYYTIKTTAAIENINEVVFTKCLEVGC